MTNPTPANLQTKCRRLEMHIEKARLVLNEMQAGNALHLQHTSTGPHWTLSNGHRVSDGIAKLIIASASVVSALRLREEGALR